MNLLKGKTAIITGGSRGIGKGISEKFAENGANVVFTCIKMSDVSKDLEKKLEKLGVKAKAYESDAADFNASIKLAEDVLNDFGSIDVLVNNAGITKDNLLMRMSEEDFNDVIYILLITSIFSCSKYQKVLKSDDVNFKYSQAVKYYKNAEFNKALPIFNELIPIFKGTNKAEEIAFYFAFSHYSTGDYLMASYLFNRFTINFPRSKHVEECKYMVAYCHYQEAPEFSLDATNTTLAIDKFQDFIDKYPESDRVERCNSLMDELRLNLSRKAFANAKQYYTTEEYRAAIIALDNVLIDFPDVENREEIYFLILESSYFLAVNSIMSKKQKRLDMTIEYYNQFIDNYPDSKFNESAKKIFDVTKITIEQLKLNKDEI